LQRRIVFPFSAVVSLDKLKLALLINAINPKIGGVLIRGPKGSGKTTLVRALVDILPKINVIKDCPFQCNPYDPSNMCPKCGERYRQGKELPVEQREMNVVNLPLGATEDRVVGSLDVEKAIKHGIEALEPGILAEANQNILYVDEINLLPDHIADDLLDAAATGWNIVEREGISVGHPSRFIFIGTMNPEEGELRPQLLDRFPLSVSVERISTVKERIEVVKRNIEFERDPEGFMEKHKESQEELRRRIVQARKILPKVRMPEHLLEAICKACLNLKVDGMRPDIVISKAAITLAAFENRTEVTLDDVLVASELALSHRTRQGGFLEPATPEEIKRTMEEAVKETAKKEGMSIQVGERKAKGRSVFKIFGETSEKEEAWLKKGLKYRLKLSKIFLALNRLFGGVIFGFGKKLRKKIKGMPGVGSVLRGKRFSPTPEKTTEKVTFKLSRVKGIPSVDFASRPPDTSKGVSLFTKLKEASVERLRLFLHKGKPRGKRVYSYAGKRAETVTTLHRGRPRGWRFPPAKPRDIHLPATIRAAARKQKDRAKPLETALQICLEDIREKLRLYKAPMTMVFVIDLSGSMLLSVDAVKKALLRLHRNAYRYRDRVGIVALKDTGAVVVQHPITNLQVVANKLLKLKISGYTPLAAGMLKAWEVLREAKRRDVSTIPVMVIITDGSANVPLTRSLEDGSIRRIEEPRIIVREYEDLAVRDVMAVSKMIRREGMHTIVVNTNPHFYGRETYGFSVTEYIASVTGGSHHIVGRLAEEGELIERMVEKIAEDQRQIAHAAASSWRLHGLKD
jgi:Mg-chelatase subunit ChlI/Mg-chelatase subunit ChlD